MTYYVEVTVKKKVASKDAADDFASRVLESTKGEGDYNINVKWVQDAQGWLGTTINNFGTTVNNPVLEDGATSVQNRLNKVSKIGLIGE